MRRPCCIAITLVVVMFAASAAGFPKPLKPKTAGQLAAVVAATGLGCDDFEAADPSNSVTVSGIPKPISQGHCTIDGQRSTVSMFASKDDLAAVLHATPTLGCSFAKATGVTTLRYVAGATWTISTPSSVTGPKLANALGAKRVTYHCKK